MMIGDAVPHIQWARAFANFHNFNIAAFSWDPAPEKYINDGVFGVETSKLSAHVLYYYGYYLVGLVAAYFYKVYAFDGHHVLFVAVGFYFLTAVIFYNLIKIYKFNSYVLLVLVFSWCVNPFPVSAIVDGGKFEVILFPIYLGFLIAVVRKRCVLGVSLALILIFTSSSYAYFLLGTLPVLVYMWWGSKIRFPIAIGATAIVVLITSHFLYLDEVQRIAQGSMSSVPVPNLASSKERLFNALKFNFGLALSYLFFTFAGLMSRFDLNKKFFFSKKNNLPFRFFYRWNDICISSKLWVFIP
jgi:hypothetical protein